MSTNRPLRQMLDHCNLETAAISLRTDLESLGQCSEEMRAQLLRVQNTASLLFNTPEDRLQESRRHCITQLEGMRKKYFDMVDLPPDVSRLTIDELENFEGDIVLAAPLILRLNTFNSIHFNPETKLHIKGNHGLIDIVVEEGVRISLSSIELPMTGILIRSTETHIEGEV